MLTQRSEFSPQMMKLLDKRVEPDAAQVMEETGVLKKYAEEELIAEQLGI